MNKKEKTGKGDKPPGNKPSGNNSVIGSQKPRREVVIALNKRAYHDFEILDKYETGIVLKGTEVKSLRDHKASLVDSYARVKKGEVWLYNANIAINIY